ncbi:MAG TPA: primosomal protein N' [Candidatus Saccharimonadales bacterium]|nr:primosomal protein N' [Candidatus Saccharimonadales bacterium]
MNFYKVWVRSARYRGQEALTYAYSDSLQPGSLVRIPLQNESVLGVVEAKTPRPSFATKPIDHAYHLPALPPELLRLATWMQKFYAAPLGVVIQQIVPVAITTPRKPLPSEPAATTTVTLPPLTPQQTSALAHITSADTYLLHGKTGTGKTRLYIELAQRAIAHDRSALILTPEIGLTSQLARNFIDVFGSRVVVLHSRLTPAERQQVWLSILKSAEPLVVIGPRSALFSPLKSIGFIAVDESHEPAYKQEQAPYYHAARVAAQLAHEHNSTLVLGSATPSVTDYLIAEQRGKTILRLTVPATAISKVHYTVIDLKDRHNFTRGRYLSDSLLTAIEQALGKGEQTLLYLNRRGTARLVVCEQCGWQAVCPHCDLPLAYHGDAHQLQCHVCGYRQAPPASCPACGQPQIAFRSIGTKAIVDEVKRLFPAARIQRFDTDNTKAERLEQHMATIHAGDVDILVGTQMIAKGLDLPRLGVVGLIAADSSLSLPDFTASERTYQLLTQVLGRIGRGHRDGAAIIQTYVPDHPVLKAAIEDDWGTFYRAELEGRKKFLFPPFIHLLQLTCRRASPKSAEQAAEKFKVLLKQKMPGIIVEGPAPSFHEKSGGKYQWQLVVKASKRSDLLAAVALLPKSGWGYDIDPMNLL